MFRFHSFEKKYYTEKKSLNTTLLIISGVHDEDSLYGKLFFIAHFI